jgi:hypothetical protein
MTSFSSPALWIVGRVTGLRVYHLVAAALAVVAMLSALALPFWWLGQQADSVAGVFGLLFVMLAYFSTSVVVLVASALLAGRFAVGRIRRTLRLI